MARQTILKFLATTIAVAALSFSQVSLAAPHGPGGPGGPGPGPGGPGPHPGPGPGPGPHFGGPPGPPPPPGPHHGPHYHGGLGDVIAGAAILGLGLGVASIVANSSSTNTTHHSYPVPSTGGNVSYYCPTSNQFYPYVTECSVAWEVR